MQFVAPAFETIGCGIGDILSFVRPLDLISFHLHQLDEMLTADCLEHHLVYHHSETKFPALTVVCRAIFSVGHRFNFLFLWL